jgi:hypothetical protein
MTRPISIRIYLLLISSIFSGCLGSAVMTPPAAAPSVDENAILATLTSGQYKTDAFRRVNDAPYKSALGSGSSLIDVYVSANAFDGYQAIAPETDGSGSTVPEGTLIVREVKDESLTVTKITLMYKGPSGYNPEVGDFWFGVTDPAGQPAVENGARQMGKVESCFGCHIARKGDGWLFGVPMAQRPGAMMPGQDPSQPPQMPPTMDMPPSMPAQPAPPSNQVPRPGPVPSPPPDTEPPTFAGLTRADSLADHCHLTWSFATDNVTITTHIVYNIYTAPEGTPIDFTTPQSSTAPGATSADIGFDTAGTFDVVVRAVDEAGNIDSNLEVRQCIAVK